ncbi:MAG: sulfate adenylyltransferase subunit CysN [bacterium]|nr:sulfate adenylyltransferase subunit CysN [bacterium]
MSASHTVQEFIRNNAQKDILRFSTCGSIDDGKSTLIGRLLHDSKNVYEDHIAAIKQTSRKRNFSEEIDFSLFTDGLKAEREQNITIDVAYRYFSTPRRTFIIADTPGHEQYTRNMATGASTANLAVLLIDARNGVVTQTKRHSFILSLLGVPHLIIAINKMDIVGYRQDVFEAIKSDYEDFARKLDIKDVRFIPISALKGDNVVHRSTNMPWYDGLSLLELLETIYIGSDYNLVDLRFPVQCVIRPSMDFRGYAGTIASGIIRRGDEVMILPSGTVSRVARIVTYDGELDEAFPPMSVTITLADERDISRGDMIVHRHNLPRLERHFEAMLVWMDTSPMDLNRSYFLKHTTRTTRVRIDEVRYRVDVNTLTRQPAQPLTLNEIGRVVFTSVTPLMFDAYQRNRATGGFILIDPHTNATAAAGMIIEREPSDHLPSHITGPAAYPSLTRHESLISREQRSTRFGHAPATVWLTGLVGSRKTAIAYALEKRLFDLGAVAIVLDGENMRLGLSKDLDFSSAGRAEHLRRAAELARLLNDAGFLVICAFTSPNADIRRQVAQIIGLDRFFEVYAQAPLQWCEQHDTTGLYAKARRGELPHFAGINAPYEPPAQPALVLDIPAISVQTAVDLILTLLRQRGIFTRPSPPNSPPPPTPSHSSHTDSP